MSDERNSDNLPSDGHSFVSSNGNGHKQLSLPRINASHSDKRKADLKLAAFCLTVAAALIITDALGRIGKPAVPASDQYSIEGITLAVHPHNGTRVGLRVPFRLSNMGKYAVFMGFVLEQMSGQILVQDSGSSKWIDQPVLLPDQQPEVVDPRVSWIEMPPGGWIDGFEDHIESPGDHAYAVFLRLDRVRIMSAPYRYNR